MNRTYRIIKTTLFFIPFFFILGCSPNKILPSATSRAHAGNLNIMFLQSAKSGSLVPISAEKGSYLITLNNVDPYLSYFSDRPNRVTGLLPLDNFIKLWSHGSNKFDTNPPNVAIETTKIKLFFDKKKATILATLTQPAYNKKTHQLSYRLTTLTTKLPRFKKAKLGFTELFIDGINIKANKFPIHWHPGGIG